ncbi:hypothetical protein F4561_002184 [Lipingzhangella halophila]|uniref:Uncharacterized protein n=1 Tax=Lipingzhangella halophila TaxID=1783352 RepID=A0A7W7W325_9ACTN|nr:DUF6247 family protein [Lipingzhangella halophila]MBB4931364.1 hypothetical protein [Lipingzhangella halophila]
MTTPATSPTDDILDPQRILAALPEREHEQFLAEYRAAAETAMHDPAQWGHLRRVLHVWRMKSVACNTPGFYQRRAEAANPGPDTVVPAGEVMPGWNERLAELGLTDDR